MIAALRSSDFFFRVFSEFGKMDFSSYSIKRVFLQTLFEQENAFYKGDF